MGSVDLGKVSVTRMPHWGHRGITAIRNLNDHL